MELSSFKELLLKKAEDNPTLQTMIVVMKDEIIAQHVLESLEKMARPHSSMGRGSNAAVTAFANQMKNKDVEMLRDALGHHISHYKSALKHGKRDLADQHLNKIIPMMHLAAKASAHSGGQLGMDYVPIEPWETNYTSMERRPETGKLKEGTKGLGRRPKKTDRSINSRGVPDYRYLEMPPHGEHGDMKRSPHKGGYPFEELQIGNPSKIDSGEAYLHISDVDPQDAFVSHPFDNHPIHSLADHKQDSLTPEKMQSFADEMSKWHSSEHNTKWMQSLKDAHAKDPEGFMSRGKKKPSHHYEGFELTTMPHHKGEKISAEDKAALPKELQEKFAKPTASVEQVKPVASEQAAPKVETPAVATSVAPTVKPPSLSDEHIAALPAALRAKFGGGK